MTGPKVSMVMPCHNKIKYIDNTLRSVYEQRWDNIELVLVNDGATDGTREAMERWRPRFMQRGYSCIIIDQPNQGIQAAVLNGMQRMTGELFCCVDCDDELHPEYVSSMAGCLRDDTGYAWVACDFDYYIDLADDRRISPRPKPVQHPSGSHMLLKYLAGTIPSYSWQYMVRVSYLKKCRVMELFAAQPRATQEPFLLVPLICGGGALKFIPKPLYRHNECGRSNPLADAETRIPNYLENLLDFREKLLGEMPAGAAELELAKKYIPLSRFSWACKHGLDEYGPLLAERAAGVANKLLTLDTPVQASQIGATGFRVFCHAVDAGLGIRDRLPWEAEQYGRNRVIGYGAKGRNGKRDIPGLLNTMLHPDVLWDMAAEPGEMLHGIPVQLPDFSSLRPDDVLILLPGDPHIINDLRRQFASRGVATIIDTDTLRDFFAQKYYPAVYHYGGAPASEALS